MQESKNESKEEEINNDTKSNGQTIFRRSVLQSMGALSAIGFLETDSALASSSGFPSEGGKSPPSNQFESIEAASTTRDCYYYTIREGTPEATQVYVIRSGNPGPTGFVMSGVHGDETSGNLTGSYIRRRWNVKQGTLVILPRANEVAIDRGTREYDEGDLNRQYPQGSEPTTALARAIWNTILRHDPDVVIDVHNSRGIYHPDSSICPSSDGQSIRPSPSSIPTKRASNTIERLNQDWIPDSLPDDYRFELRQLAADTRLLDKLHADLGKPCFVPEVTRCGTDIYTQQIPWLRFAVRDLLEQYGIDRIELPETGECDPLPTISTGNLTRSQPTPETWFQFDAPSQPDRVVIAKPVSYNGEQPCHVRLRNVNAGDFEYKLEEWAYLDRTHTTETTHFMAVRPGDRELQLDGGNTHQLRAGTIPVDHTFSTVSLGSQFTAPPVVFSQSQTYNGSDPIVTRIQNVSNTSFDVRLHEEEAGGAHKDEIVGYIALKQGMGTSGGHSFEVKRSSESLTHQWKRITFSRSYDSPRFIANLQTFNGLDTAQLRYRNLTSDSVELKVEEEQSSDSETAHTTEAVGYAVFEGSV